MQDAYEQLGAGGTDMRGRVRIQFMDDHGTHEAGIDGGGLFKDFMEGLVKEGFSLRTCVLVGPRAGAALHSVIQQQLHGAGASVSKALPARSASLQDMAVAALRRALAGWQHA